MGLQHDNKERVAQLEDRMEPVSWRCSSESRNSRAEFRSERNPPVLHSTNWDCCLSRQTSNLQLRWQVVKLPPCYQFLKTRVFLHLLEQGHFYPVPPWTQVCPGGSTFCILAPLSLLQLSHRKATRRPERQKTFFNSTDSEHQRATWQTLQRTITKCWLFFQNTQLMNTPHRATYKCAHQSHLREKHRC